MNGSTRELTKLLKLIKEGYADVREQFNRYTDLIKDVDLEKRLLEISALYIDPALKTILENKRRQAQRNNIRNLHAMKEKAKKSYFNRIEKLLQMKKLNQRGMPKFVRVATAKYKMLH